MQLQSTPAAPNRATRRAEESRKRRGIEAGTCDDDDTGKNAQHILTVREAAEYVRLSKPTLDRLRCAGGGPKFARLGTAGGAVRYRRADLDAWIEQKIRHSTSEAA